ncbi:IS5 family transposase ISMex42 [Methylobacterium iners]|uniref:IS5 family transposase ISMex42 n=1 Tax=Methylobacterium iners TaxID=418707 RepID=A0ABQ4S6H9_9HYPH|nr:IS5 family transposase ISMex42 [Methylobacterium iners]
MLSNAQGAVLGPLLEACGPHSKVPPSNLSRTISAILWRHENGAKWRSLPVDLGPWWMAAQTFIRRSRLGVWERLLALVQEHGIASASCFSTARACALTRRRLGLSEKGLSSCSQNAVEALGRSRGGFGTKACVVADGSGRAIAFQIAPGQAHELPHALPLLDHLPGVPMWVVADRG